MRYIRSEIFILLNKNKLNKKYKFEKRYLKNSFISFNAKKYFLLK